MVSTPTMRATLRSTGAENTSCTEPLWRTRLLRRLLHDCRAQGPRCDRGSQDRQDLQLDEPTPELPPQMLSGRSVERGQRLVEQEQMRPTDQRARQRDALLLSSGQLPRIAVSETGQPEQRRDLLDALPPLRRRDLAQAVAEVLGYTQMGEEGVILEQVSDPAALRREKIPRAASNQISLPTRMVPRSGLSRPAKHRSVVDFPEPGDRRLGPLAKRRRRGGAALPG